MANPDPYIGLRIRQLREQKEMSRMALAVASRQSISKIQRIEKGAADVTLSDLKAIAVALAVSICAVCQMTDECAQLMAKSADDDSSDLNSPQ